MGRSLKCVNQYSGKNVPSISNQLEYNLHKAHPVLMRRLFLGFKYRQNTNQQTVRAS